MNVSSVKLKLVIFFSVTGGFTWTNKVKAEQENFKLAITHHYRGKYKDMVCDKGKIITFKTRIFKYWTKEAVIITHKRDKEAHALWNACDSPPIRKNRVTVGNKKSLIPICL